MDWHKAVVKLGRPGYPSKMVDLEGGGYLVVSRYGDGVQVEVWDDESGSLSCSDRMSDQDAAEYIESLRLEFASRLRNAW